MNQFVKSIFSRGPIEFYFDVEELTADMREWLLDVQSADFDTESSADYFGIPMHQFAGSAKCRIFMKPQQRDIAVMFLLKFNDKIYRHNLEDSLV